METTPEWLGFLSPFLQGLLVATGIGLIAGLEREFRNQSEAIDFAGLRTFPLVAITGFILGFLSQNEWSWLLPAGLLGFSALLVVAYFMQAKKEQYGITTEMALLLVFVLGALVAKGHVGEAMAAAVILTTLLSLKEQLHRFVKQITEGELYAFIKFFLLALLVMLILPDTSFGPEGLFNYRSIGWVVVIVSLLGFVGYLLMKFVDLKRGLLLAAVVGGLYSSTMVAWVFAARSRATPAAVPVYGAGIILASCVMFGRVVLLSSFFSPPVALRLLLPCGMMLSVGLLSIWYLLRREKKGRPETAEPLQLGNPLDIGNALFFALLYGSISLLMYYSSLWFGDKGVYLIGAISGIADSDAITISTAKWGAQADRYTQAAAVIVVAVLSNSIFKATVAAVRGHSSLVKPLLVGFGGILVAGLGWLLVWGL